MVQDKIEKIYLILFSLIPISIIIGSAISLLNILVILIFFLTFTVKSLDKKILKNPTVLCLLIIYGYLIFNSFIAINLEISASRNFGFIRLIFLFIAINYLFSYSDKTKKIFIFWALIILIVIFDSFIEFFLGRNILGYGEVYGERIVSFFKDEPIVAAYLNGFCFLLIGFFFDKYYFKNNYFKFIFYISVIIFFSCILITGERSNTIKTIFALIVFFYLNPYLNLKSKIFITFGMIVIFTLIFNNSKYIKYRYFEYFIPFITGKDNVHFISNNNYIVLYKSGYEVFKNYPYFGVGNKNYRLETKDIEKNKHYKNNSHPHQIYLELLSEHGIIGTIILLSLFFVLIFKNLKIIILTKNSVQLGAFAYLVSVFLPIIPSGSFFNNFNISLFFLNLSILYACNSKTNIFQKSS